jgi:MFS family permease
MIVLDTTIVNVALPTIHKSLHFSTASLEWLITAYALTFGGLLQFGGRTGDLYGKRRMFMTGIAIFATASLLGGLATTEAWLPTGTACRSASSPPKVLLMTFTRACPGKTPPPCAAKQEAGSSRAFSERSRVTPPPSRSYR